MSLLRFQNKIPSLSLQCSCEFSLCHFNNIYLTGFCSQFCITQTKLKTYDSLWRPFLESQTVTLSPLSKQAWDAERVAHNRLQVGPRCCSANRVVSIMFSHYHGTHFCSVLFTTNILYLILPPKAILHFFFFTLKWTHWDEKQNWKCFLNQLLFFKKYNNNNNNNNNLWTVYFLLWINGDCTPFFLTI